MKFNYNETPLTDSVEEIRSLMNGDKVVSAEYSRKLERALRWLAEDHDKRTCHYADADYWVERAMEDANK